MAKKNNARTKTHRSKKPAAPSAPATSAVEKSILRTFGPWIALGVFILACVALVFFLTRPAPNYNYNNYPFTKANCPGTEKPCYFAELTINNVPYTIPFYYHPKDVENIAFQYDALDTLRTAYSTGNATVFIGVPEGAPGQIAIAGTELSRVLGKRYGILNFDVQAKVIGTGADQIDCDVASPSRIVIAFQQGPVDAIILPSPNCIVISATTPDRAIAVADAFVYRLFGVIKTMRAGPAPSHALVNATLDPNATLNATP